MSTTTIKLIGRTLNALELCGIIVVLLAAFVFQFAFGELPCPLCLLQRVGFVMMAFGFILNLRFGLRPSHYALVILSALYTAFVALRQIALHVLPGSGAYGSPFLGYHMYTWSFILSMVIIVFTTIMLSIDRQYFPVVGLKRNKIVSYILMLIVLGFIGMNIVSTLMECGIKQCPDNPTQYRLP